MRLSNSFKTKQFAITQMDWDWFFKSEHSPQKSGANVIQISHHQEGQKIENQPINSN